MYILCEFVCPILHLFIPGTETMYQGINKVLNLIAFLFITVAIKKPMESILTRVMMTLTAPLVFQQPLDTAADHWHLFCGL